MRQGYERAAPFRLSATQNLVLRAGFCLALALNAVPASPSSTAGLSGASVHAVLVGPVAVNNSAGVRIGSNDNSTLGRGMEGGAIAEPMEQPPFHVQGLVTPARFHLSGIYEPADRTDARHYADAIMAHLRDEAPLTARRVLEEQAVSYLDPDDFTALRTRVAAGLLHAGYNKAALNLAEQSLADHSDEALWTAGLAAYRLEQNDKAAHYFKAVANQNLDSWTTGAAAFWAARSLTNAGDPAGARHWLALAAGHGGTFYGMLAQRAIDAADAGPRKPAARVFVSYTVPHWKPREGFTVDPALIYAIMRQESKFDPDAESDAGALGLMQVMPRTAGEVTQRHADWKTLLFDPQTNLDIGQRYVSKLLQSDGVSNNLMMMAVAYNGGPTTLDRWRRNNDENDPLLFLETIPVNETRGFIEQVLTNYWNYRAQLGEDTASLDDLAAGKWPMYATGAAKPTLVADSR